MAVRGGELGRVLSSLLIILIFLAPPAAARCHGLAPPRDVPAASAGEWTLATFNLWRLRDTDKDAPLDQPLTPAIYRARLDALAGYLIDRLKTPTLVAVQEVENRAILEDLAQRIHQRGGPVYKAVLVEGNDPSGMDVGLLYRLPARVGKVRTLFADQKFRHHALFSRPPLWVTMTGPASFSLIVVHLRSARGLGKKAWVAEKRRRQADRLTTWVQGHSGALVVAGDFNSGPGKGAFGQPWRRISEAGLYDSGQRLLATERYSYRHRCQPAGLDHILLSSEMEKRLKAVAVSRGNAGRYKVLYGHHGTRVVSDHDVPVVYFSD